MPTFLPVPDPTLASLDPSLEYPVEPSKRWLVQVCQHRSCLRQQGAEVLAAFQAHQSDNILVAASGCMGQCSSGPTVRVLPDDVWYCRLRPGDVETIVSEHLGQGQPVSAYLHPRFHKSPED